MLIGFLHVLVLISSLACDVALLIWLLNWVWSAGCCLMHVVARRILFSPLLKHLRFVLSLSTL